jgi:aminomethyltransferase
VIVSEQSLKRTALNAAHRALGAKMVDFAGWDMPVEYAGLVAEHMAVRTAAGLFDVSHMGEIEVCGPQALACVQFFSCNDASKLADGQIQYSGLMHTAGTFVDDILVHRFAADHYFICVNASNADKDFDWMRRHAGGFDAEIRDVSAQYAQIALQGPRAIDILQPLIAVDLSALKYYRFIREVELFGAPTMIARTGYTGEDGVEVYCGNDAAETIWNGLLGAGAQKGLTPAGLGARNTLRLEAKMALYGHEIDDTTTVLEADLGWICKLDKGDFIGADALRRQKAEGVRRKLVGFEVEDRAPVRDGYALVADGQEVGRVTSGSPSPFLKKNIGLAYLPVELTAVGTQFFALVRGRETPCRVVTTPFYQRKK